MVPVLVLDLNYLNFKMIDFSTKSIYLYSVSFITFFRDVVSYIICLIELVNR